MLGERNYRCVDEPPAVQRQPFGLRQRLALNLLRERPQFLDFLLEHLPTALQAGDLPPQGTRTEQAQNNVHAGELLLEPRLIFGRTTTLLGQADHLFVDSIEPALPFRHLCVL
jgi:hypothetical protein